MAVNIKNKKASYTYFLTDEFTAGLVLSGSEIKSIRAGKASITESYCRFDKGELWVHNNEEELIVVSGVAAGEDDATLADE